MIEFINEKPLSEVQKEDTTDKVLKDLQKEIKNLKAQVKGLGEKDK